MKHSTACKMIDEAYWRVARCCESDVNWERYVALNEDEERRHRRGAPDGIAHGLSICRAVRLFAVKELFEIQTGTQYRPTPEDWFMIRPSIFAAWAIWKLNGEKLLKEFSEPECKAWLEAIDYAELNKDRHQLQAA